MSDDILDKIFVYNKNNEKVTLSQLTDEEFEDFLEMNCCKVEPKGKKWTLSERRHIVEFILDKVKEFFQTAKKPSLYQDQAKKEHNKDDGEL